jgi:parallel beta-helix repeat protein
MNVTVKLLLSFALFVSLFISVENGYSQACVSGGTVSGPVNYSVQSNKTISGLRIDGGGGNCISLTGCTNITITNCILGPSGGYGISLKGCSNITIVNCSFEHNYAGVYAENCTTVKVNNNQFTNVAGGFPRGQYVQFNTVTGAGSEIKDNTGEIAYGALDPQDLINVYKSSGTAASPINISGNKFRHGSYNNSSGGILVGDNGGSYITVQNNTLVNTGHFGIGVAGGNNIRVLNNNIYIRPLNLPGYYADVSGVYVWGQGPGPCSNIDLEGNAVDYDHTPGNGKGYDSYYQSTCDSPVPVIIANNNWEASLGAGILPDRLLCPLLMAHYPFNATWNDASGSGLNATSNNVPFDGQGKDHICASFNGTARYLTLPSSRWLQAQSQRFTVSCWIKPWTLQGVQGIAQAQSSDGFNNGWRMVLNGGVFNGHLVTDIGAVDVYCGGLTVGSWAHIVMVYDGSQLKGYVNGVLQSSAAVEGNVLYSTTSSAATIGYCNGTNYLNAYLDEFKFYDGWLTDAEVLADYNADYPAVNAPPPQVRLSYAFNNSWADGSGNGLTAATHGVGFVCNGANSSSASFNGSSYLTLPSSSFLTPYSNNFTVSCWIKPATVTGIKAIAQAQNSDGYNNGWRMLLLDGTFNGRVYTNQGPKEVYAGGIQAGVWNYVTMTYDGTALKAYVNGVLQNSVPWGGYITYGTARQMEIGFCKGDYYFNGYMDEFRFYDGAMSAGQIQQDYNTMYPIVNATPNCPSSQQTAFDNGTAAVLEGASDKKEGYTVYPNPARDQVTITGTSTRTMLRVGLYNVLGQSVRWGYGSSDGLVLLVGDLPAGIYYLRIYDGAKVKVQKILILR